MSQAISNASAYELTKHSKLTTNEYKWKPSSGEPREG